MKIKDIKEVIKLAITHKVTSAPPIMIGHAGIGKTQTIKDIATELNLPYAMLRIASLNDVGDLYGMPYINDHKETVYGEPSWYKTIKNGGILFLDELNRAKPTLQDAIMQLLDIHKFNDFVLPDNCFIVGAMNPNDENYDVNEFDKAIVDRCVIMPAHQNEDGVLQYLIDHEFNEEVIDIVAMSKDVLSLGGNVTTPKKDFTPRAIRQLDSWMPVIQQVKDEVANEIVLGCIGPVGFKQWANKEILKKVPEAPKYFNDPKQYDVENLDPICKTIFVTRVFAYLRNKKANEDIKKKFTELMNRLGEQILAYIYRLSNEVSYIDKFIDFNDPKLKEICGTIKKVLEN